MFEFNAPSQPIRFTGDIIFSYIRLVLDLTVRGIHPDCGFNLTPSGRFSFKVGPSRLDRSFSGSPYLPPALHQSPYLPVASCASRCG